MRTHHREFTKKQQEIIAKNEQHEREEETVTCGNFFCFNVWGWIRTFLPEFLGGVRVVSNVAIGAFVHGPGGEIAQAAAEVGINLFEEVVSYEVDQAQIRLADKMLENQETETETIIRYAIDKVEAVVDKALEVVGAPVIEHALGGIVNKDTARTGTKIVVDELENLTGTVLTVLEETADKINELIEGEKNSISAQEVTNYSLFDVLSTFWTEGIYLDPDEYDYNMNIFLSVEISGAAITK